MALIFKYLDKSVNKEGICSKIVIIWLFVNIFFGFNPKLDVFGVNLNIILIKKSLL